MKLNVSETAKLTGVSVRTLHYYDEIGLLKPDFVDEQNSYRYYSEKSLGRLQEILFYRELDFSLKDIQQILSNPNYNKTKALSSQKELLTLKKCRLERLIDMLDKTLKEENTMNFNAFDNTEFETQKEQYAKEAKERWGNTDAYKESMKKTGSYTDKKWTEVILQTDGIMKEFAELKISGMKPSDEASQVLVKKLQTFITDNYYSCTKEILSGLGAMYTADERFKANIDRHGKGTAEFITKSIEIYCNS